MLKSKPSELTVAGDFCFVFKRGMGGRRCLGDGGAYGELALYFLYFPLEEWINRRLGQEIKLS